MEGAIAFKVGHPRPISTTGERTTFPLTLLSTRLLVIYLSKAAPPKLTIKVVSRGWNVDWKEEYMSSLVDGGVVRWSHTDAIDGNMEVMFPEVR
jgi:hypothetical protein